MEQLTQIATQLGIDQTFFTIFSIITVLHFVLAAVYSRPYQKLLQERKEKTEGAKKEAKDMVSKAEEKRIQYTDRLREAHDRARAFFNDAEVAAKKEETKILGEAANKAKDVLQKTQDELQKQKSGLIEALSKEATSIAEAIAQKVLGR